VAAIVSSNRTRSEWAALIERPFDPEYEMRQPPHQPASEIIARHAITPDPFRGVTDHDPVDQTPAVWCHAPACENQ
jgi:hypothetical protein